MPYSQVQPAIAHRTQLNATKFIREACEIKIEALYLHKLFSSRFLSMRAEHRVEPLLFSSSIITQNHE